MPLLVLAFSAGYLLQQYRQPSEGEGQAAAGKGGSHANIPSAGGAPGEAPPARIGARRPNFSQRDMQGVLRDIGEWDGAALVLNFWASWCPPCRTEIPWFVAMQTQYQGLQFVGIAMQESEEIESFVEEHGINYPVLTGTRATLQLMTRYGNDAGALPYTVFIDPNGIITRQHHGPLSEKELHHIVQALLEAK